MKEIKIVFISIILASVCSVSLANRKISNLRLCADKNCETLISTARTEVKYNSIDKHMLSFLANKQVRVLSKSAGTNSDLWGIEFQGQRGYANKKMLREMKIYVADNKLIEISTEPFMQAKIDETPPLNEDKIDAENKPTDVQDSAEAEVLASAEVDGSQNETAVAKEDIILKNDSINDQLNENEKVGTQLDDVTDSGSKENNVDKNSVEVREHDDEDDGLEEEENEEDEEDEQDEQDEQYKGKEPVNEPEVLKKHAYQTGEKADEIVLEKSEVLSSEEVAPEKSNPPDGEADEKAINEPHVTLEIVGAINSSALENESTNSTENKTEDRFIDQTNALVNSTIESKSQDEKENSDVELAKPETILDTKATESVEEATTVIPKNAEKSENIVNSLPDKDDSIKPAEAPNTDTPTVKTEEIPTPQTDNESNNVNENATDSETNLTNDTISNNVNEENNSKEINPLDLDTQEKENLVQSENSQELNPIEANATDQTVNDHNNNSLLTEIKENVPEEATHSNENQVENNVVPKITTPPPYYLSPSILGNRVQGVNAETTSDPQQTRDNKNELNDAFKNDIPSIAPNQFQPAVQTEDTRGGSIETHNLPEHTDVPVTSESNAETLSVTTVPPIVDFEVPPPVSTWDGVTTENPIDIFSENKPSRISNEPNWYDDVLNSASDLYANFYQLIDFSSSNNEEARDGSSESALKQTVVAAADVDLENAYCEKLDDGSCPKQPPKSIHTHQFDFSDVMQRAKNIKYDEYAEEFLAKVVSMADLVILLTLTAITVLIFTLGHYCITNNRKENALISKLNILEKKLHTTDKECSLVKIDLIQTRNKLASIEDNSFGSNDMVIALKEQLEQSDSDKLELLQQITSLEKELETAAEAGLELNKMVSELLNNQSGSDSIISSVEELQHQLNEQEATTFSINNLLAEKSRENSELQVLLSEKNGKYEQELEELLKSNDVLKLEKESIEAQLRDNIYALETQLNRELEAKANELTKLIKDHTDLKSKHDFTFSKWQLSEARAEALEASIKKLKQIDGKADLRAVLETTNSNAKLLALGKEKESLKEKLEGEIDARNLLEDHVKVINDEIARLRTEYNQAEKDKLEAQTRLEVLSNYFKDKETQLQKELSVKEALFMKQQGESTSTVERIRSLQEEIQALKSQNDQLRAEIDAQAAAHKAQINAAESRAHDSWLAAKQAERRFEEVRAEAGVLRRKLTSLTVNSASLEHSLLNHHNNADCIIPNDMNAPSPIHMETPGSPPLIAGMPPPPFLPLPPFIAGSSMNLPFMPPPPLLPIPGEMRPPPLGRLMSPPPPLHPNNRFSPNNFVDDRGRYGNRYSPDSRYDDDYPNGMSIYDTETDFSPPRSPEPRQFYRDRDDYGEFSPIPSPPPPLGHTNRKKKPTSKGETSAGSFDSSSSKKSRGGKV